MNMQPSKLIALCEAIKTYEGWGAPGSVVNGVKYPKGTRSFVNSNPGNCRYSRVGYLKMYGEVKKDKDGFAIFSSYNIGFLYLVNLIRYKIHQHPNWTITQLMRNYAPASDGNNPERYAKWLARRIGVNIKTFKIMDLLT